jgi:DNA polymerase I-like protein with 3'-5' exonuclease and polymerase domains
MKKLPNFLSSPDPRIYLNNNYILVDIETTNIENGSPYNKDNRIITVQYKLGPEHPDYEDDRVRVVVGNEYHQQTTIELCEKAEFIVAHNAKFDIAWLVRCGLNIEQVLPYCTMLGEYVIAGNRKFGLSLDESAKRYGLGSKESYVSKLIKSGVCPSEIVLKDLISYGAQDVRLLESLFLLQRARLDSDELLNAFFTRNIFTPALIDIEARGMCLDANRVIKVYKKLQNKLNLLEYELAEITGGANPKSTVQMRDVIYNKLNFLPPRDYRKQTLLTPKGESLRRSGVEFNEQDYYATNVAAIRALKPKNKQQKLFKDLKIQVSKLRDSFSKTLEKFYNCVAETDDNLLFAYLNQTITQTHRLSSTGRHYKAQFQNFPRDFKPIFKAREDGWLIGEIDAAQLEFRSAAFQAQDSVAIEKIKDHFDVHSFTSETLTKAGQATNRQDAKPHTFKPLYYGSSGTPAEQAYYQAFKEMYPDITRTQEEWINEVLTTKKLRICNGLIFYWPDTKMTKSGYVTNSTSICNYPVQSFATADIVPIAVTYQWHLMKAAGMESYIINTIHDSSISEIYPPERELFEEIGVQAYTDVVVWYLKEVYDLEFNCPLEAEVKIGTHWATNEKWENEYLK